MSSLLNGYQEVIGTKNGETIDAGGYQIAFGLQGIDLLMSGSYTDPTILVGGSGNDFYLAGPGTSTVIVDSGGYDQLTIIGLGYSTYTATFNGKHFVTWDTYTQTSVIVANWLTSPYQIDVLDTPTGKYSLVEVVNAAYASGSHLGEISIPDLASIGIFEPGTTAAQVDEAVNYLLAREADIISPPPPPTPLTDAAAFDANFYLAANPDVRASGTEAIVHYSAYGWKEGRDPNTWFDTSWYLAQNQDVAATGMEPLKHFQQHGVHEGRDPNAWFDTSWYLAENTDVAEAGLHPVTHYWQYGWEEGRDPSSAFDTSDYLAANPDVEAAGLNPLQHWLQYGMAEGRALAPVVEIA